MLLNNEQVNNETTEEIKRFLEKNENERTIAQNLWDSEGSPEREVHSNTGLPKKDRKMSDKQPNLTSTGTRGITTNKAQSEQKEGNNEDQSRIK